MGKHKKKKPEIRFKGFTDDWEQCKFEDLGSVAMCKRIFKEQTYLDGDIPFYKIGTFGGEPDAFISRELFEDYKGRFQYPNKGDILISASGTIGRLVEYRGEEAYFQDSNIVWLNHDDRIDNSFLHYIYEIVKWAGIEGSTIKRLYNENFLKTDFSMPKLAEQIRIGKYFSNLDNFITLHQRKLNKLKKVKKSMLEKMFPQNGEKEPQIRFCGFNSTWEQRKLEDIAKRVQGNDGRMNLPTLTISAAVGWMNQLDRFYGNIAGKEQQNYTLLHRGDLSYNHGNSKLAKYGTVFSLQSYEEALVPRVYHSFRMINGSADFIEYYFATRLMDRELSKLISSGARMDGLLNISYDEFVGMTMKLPSIEEQNKIAGYFRKVNSLITLHQRKLEKLKKIKKAMLEKMFVGEK